MNQNTQSDVHLSHYWEVLLKRWKLGLVILLIVVLATVAAHYFTTPLYRASILLQIERDSTAQYSIEDLFAIPSRQEYLQTQIQLLKSRGMGLRVVEDLDLLENQTLNPGGTENLSPEEQIERKNALAGRIASGIRVEAVEGTSLVRVAYIGTDPKLVQEIANGIGESYVKMNIERKSESVRQATRFLRSEIEKLQQEIDAGERQVQKYGASRDIFSDEGDNLVLQRLESLNRSYLDAQARRISAESALRTVRSASAQSIPTIADDWVIRGLRADLQRLEREYEQKRTNFRPAHPEMQRLANEIEGARKNLANATQERLQSVREAARKDLEDAIERERELEKALEEQKTRALELNIDAVDYLAQRTNLASKKELLNELTQRLNETEVTSRLKGADSSNIHIIEDANQPGYRYNASLKKNLKNAFPLGLVMAVGAIFFLEYMDRSIRSAEELEQVSGFPTLGVIPAADRGGKPGYGYGYGFRSKEPPPSDDQDARVELIPDRNPKSPVSEAYRALRTSLLLSSAEELRKILVTSSVPKEGKSTTTVNLATVLAQMGKRVIVVDADLRKPKIRQIFEAPSKKGLVDYLAHQAEIEDVIESSKIANLSFIQSGPIPPNPSELLASPRMRALLDSVTETFDYVLIDSPPVLPVADAVILGNQVDGVVLCVQGGKTPREVVQRASGKLRQAGTHTLGALLNNLDARSQGYRYTQQYYEYYGDSSRT
ncbi:MAG: polysaccharide biosynthesis tyrosine autokinase [Thermoanaerobaculia bacterium]|nr:polysaccharide biosynthesis tyrosine autokinase [Thermoanaerobaculia bacterium]